MPGISAYYFQPQPGGYDLQLRHFSTRPVVALKKEASAIMQAKAAVIEALESKEAAIEAKELIADKKEVFEAKELIEAQKEVFEASESLGVWSSTASGLKFVDETIGSGERPPPDAVVSVHYTVTMASTGWELGSSRRHPPLEIGWPLTFALAKEEVPLFTEAVDGMRVGGCRRLMVPFNRVPPSQRSNVPQDESGEELRLEIELLRVETGLPALIPTMLPPRGRRVAILRAILALSFVPYLLPDGLKPSIYEWKDVEAIHAAREAVQADLWHGVPIDSLWP